MFPFNDSLIKKIRSVRPDRLVALFPQNEPLGHAVSTEIIRGYHGAYTATNLGQPGIQGSGLTSAGYDGAASFNNIYTASFANDNGLANPGFEAPGAGPPVWLNWVDTLGDGALANEVVIVHEGTDAAKITSGPLSDTSTYGAVVVVPGQRRRFRFWSQGDGVNAGRYIIWDATNGANIQAMTSTGITAAAWGMVEVEYTVPATCVLVHEFLACPNVNGGIAYFDACEDRRTNGFLGDKGSIVAWAQVANVGVWTDGVERYMIRARASATNDIRIRRSVINNTIDWVYTVGGVAKAVASVALGGVLLFMMIGMTWDIAADELIAYANGAQVGLTQNGLGTWVGDLQNTVTVIGASSTVPAAVWSGNIGPVPVWSEALTPDEMRYLGT